jgi:ribosomal protein S18 acetylase RimI-like enzyme
MNTRYSKKIIISFFLVAAACAVVPVSYYYYYCASTSVYTFDQKRDASFILDIFKHDWHWLVSEYSTDFSPEYMLAHRASSKNPEHLGNLTIKVLYAKQEPLGFTAYYKKKFYEGFVLFLAIRHEFRSKGYAKILLRHAMDDLIAQGCTKIRLVTRTTNYPAMKVYRNAGFVETSREDGFIYFEYKV